MCSVYTVLLGKPPLANKIQKNNAKTRDRSGRCR